MTQSLLSIKAYGKAAEAKLKALIDLDPEQARNLPPSKIAKINRIAAKLAKGYDPKVMVSKRVMANAC